MTKEERLELAEEARFSRDENERLRREAIEREVAAMKSDPTGNSRVTKNVHNQYPLGQQTPMPFGISKGKQIYSMPIRDLRWAIEYLSGNLSDMAYLGGRGCFATKDAALLRLLRESLEARGGI